MLISWEFPVVILVDHRQVGLGSGCYSNHTLRVYILKAVLMALLCELGCVLCRPHVLHSCMRGGIQHVRPFSMPSVHT